MSDRDDYLIVLDRSGSMHGRKADHEGGLRSFVGDLRKLGGDVRLTFVRFDTTEPCEVVFLEQPINEVRDDVLVLTPRGGTPLLDAVGRALALVAHLDQVTVMVITDGGENSSREWTRDAVKKLVAEREQKGGKVLYLGANVDEFEEAAQLGVNAGAALGYSDKAGATVSATYMAAAQSVTRGARARRAGLSGQAVNAVMNFTSEERLLAQNDQPEKGKP